MRLELPEAFVSKDAATFRWLFTASWVAPATRWRRRVGRGDILKARPKSKGFSLGETER